MNIDTPLTSTSIPEDIRTALATAIHLNAEMVIRDIASSVTAQVRTRADHPSFGNTKTDIRRDLARMDGAIGLYMVQRGQATHASVPILAEFIEDETTERVVAARAAVAAL